MALVCALAATAAAETHRVAIVVGNNVGADSHAPLHYAEEDASKVARVLEELGGVKEQDLYLLQGRPRDVVDQALALVKAKVDAWHQRGGDRVEIIFYYSGHSDGMALELGSDRLGFGELRSWLEGTGAEVRVAIVDTCKSGALIAMKGGRPGPSFEIRLADDLATSGEALLTSSAADEMALESKEIEGSFFTHHLVSGLRGAADTSGDGVVTLAEAYHYAFAHTVSTTASTLAGPQHPVYDYRLSGQGELVLTELAEKAAAVSVPTGFDRVLLTDRARGEVVAELGGDAGGPTRLAIEPADYAVRAWKGRVAYAAHFAVARGETKELAETDFVVDPGAPAIAKGDLVGVSRARMSLEVDASLSMRSWLALDGAIPQVGGRLTVGFGRSFFLLADGTAGDTSLVHDRTVIGGAGWRWRFPWRRFELQLALLGGAGLLDQEVGGHQSAALVGASSVTLRAPLGPWLHADLGFEGEESLVQVDGSLTHEPMVAGWLGVGVDIR